MERISTWPLTSMLFGCAASSADDESSSDRPNTTIAISASASDSESGSGFDTDSDSDSDSGPNVPSKPCDPYNHQLVGTLELTTLRLGGEDVATSLDPATGGEACLDTRDGERFRFVVEFGPRAGSDPESRLSIEADIAPRSYDLATEAGHSAGEVWIVYSFTVGAGTWQNDPQSSPYFGTIEVDAVSLDDPTFDVSAVGQIGPDNGWVFDLRFVGEWADP